MHGLKFLGFCDSDIEPDVSNRMKIIYVASLKTFLCSKFRKIEIHLLETVTFIYFFTFLPFEFFLLTFSTNQKQ